MATKSYWDDSFKPQPNFENILKVLRCEAPDRPTLFEFFMNVPLYRRLLGAETKKWLAICNDEWNACGVGAYLRAGYDYAPIIGQYQVCTIQREKKDSVSINDGALIFDRATFDAFPWSDPKGGRYDYIANLGQAIPKSMKLIGWGPGGVLENVIQLVGYENLCFMLVDDESLASDIFEQVGSRLLGYYHEILKFEAIGVIIGNDDWGFKTQTMLPPDVMRKYVFPWHKEIVAAAHAAGRPAILHSCGQLESVMEDIIEDIGYDGKHSYEDGILPVEETYDRWGGRIAILGGMDIDFVCRRSPDEVYQRSKAMLERGSRGGYALGTGNSVPEYIPQENYFAMIAAALDARK